MRPIDADKTARHAVYSAELKQRVVPLAALQTAPCLTRCGQCKHGRPARREENGDVFCEYWVTDDHDKDGFCEQAEERC